ncbi:hypothetical protein JCM4814A_79700 [Streptomyces phaeofaciens JCM 4814]|uniref:Trypsin-co-occurring domain-containing protein n=2 Tax=Streptomyces phaeofaciens TaxID=68254 RepID=A0A918HRY4_9ACTN|nr:hypothetical protein GCM10010226_82940 [Streptomyces phaeofaciens]
MRPFPEAESDSPWVCHGARGMSYEVDGRGRGVMEIELADAVAVLREEVLEAAARGAGQDIAFKVGFFELEFMVELRQDARAKAGFKAWVVSGEAEGGVARGTTQLVRITLTPQRPNGGDILIQSGSSRTTRFGPGPVGDRIEDD